MRLSHLLFAFSLALALVLPARTAPPGTPNTQGAAKAAKSPKAKKHHHVLHGTVIEVKHTKSHEGTFKIRLAKKHHKKGSISAKASATKQHHRIVTVHVKQHTKVRKVWHVAGKAHHHPAHFADLHKGQHVRVVVGHHHALEVDIHVHPPVANAAAKAAKPPAKIIKKK